MKFKIGDTVTWESSNKQKTGIVIAIVPAGKPSGDYGYNPNGSKYSQRIVRDHESYIVGVKNKHGIFKPTNFWPLVNLLQKESK